MLLDVLNLSKVLFFTVLKALKKYELYEYCGSGIFISLYDPVE
jgi:hypothetical protein